MSLQSINQTADLGLRFAGSSMTKQSSPATGIYMIDVLPKMEQIKTSADALNEDVMRNVADPAFRQHWADWYATWNKYYTDVNGLWSKLFSNPFHANEIDRQVESFRLNLLGWYDAYRAQRTQNNIPVPAPSGQPPTPGKEPGKDTVTSGLPWWFWLLSGIAVVGVSYLVYRKVQEGKAKAAYAHKYAPGILTRYLGPLGKPAYEYTQAGRDVQEPNFMVSGHDPDAVAAPFRLSRYAADPSPFAAVHRGFPVRDLRTDHDEVLFEEPQRDLPRVPRHVEVEHDPYDPYDLEGDY
jgi:hypothetical protein